MRAITVLSPHRDDAVFSLGAWMKHWTETATAVSVFNFYTRTAYAPWLVASGDPIARRAYEDRAAMFQISPDIRHRSFGFFDAPIRLRCGVQGVMGQSARAVRADDAAAVATCLRHLDRAAFVLAPLGLGGHIDHLTVRQAALQTIPPHRLAFYHDLPYLDWTSPDEFATKLKEVERSPLRRVRCPPGIATRLQKQHLAAMYKSQIGREDAKLIARHLPEAIWVPAGMLSMLHEDC